MQTKNRRQQVLAALQEKRIVKIRDLAETLAVSSMTIRRDLNRLAEQSIVTLLHGGAVLNEGSVIIPSVAAREKKALEEKNQLAALCASMVTEGSSVYIDCGSTAKSIAEALLDKKNIVILSHSLPVFNILSASEAKMIFVPGVYCPQKKGSYGPLTVDFLQNFQMDIAFLGFSAVQKDIGLMVPDLQDAAVKKTLLKKARKKVAVIDHSKLDKLSFVKVCDFHEIDIFITDKPGDPKITAEIRRQGAEVILV